MLVPAQHVHAAEELTNQYRVLVGWQIAGFLLVLDGTMLLCFLYFTGLMPVVMAASVLFPVAVALLPTVSLIGLGHAVFRKPALRQKIAEMGVNSSEWARPLEAPLRAFWIGTGIFTFAMLLVGVLLVSSRGQQERGEDYTQRTSPTLYEREYQYPRGIR